MKIATFRGLHGRIVSSAVSAFLLASPSLSAVQVDSELVILVDVSGSVSNAEFSNVMEGVAASFESSSVVDSIVSGTVGSIAASLVFWSSNNRQQVGVSWLEIQDLATATQFAASIRAASRPFRGRSAIGSALAYAAASFGTETGGAGNGFESNRQMITLIGDGRDNNTPGTGSRAQRVQAARDAAVASGVDEISAILLNASNVNLANYYQDNIIGGDGSGDPQLATTDIDDVDEAVLAANIANTVSAGVAVPEPSSFLLVGVAGAFLFSRRRSKNSGC